jgi:trehalose/maltose hydrolase-like predicted phosphorylase
MDFIWIITTLLLSSSGMVKSEDYVYESNTITEKMQLPTLANGHIGFPIFNDSMTLNGLYNGKTGVSHRARIPNFGNIQLKNCLIELKKEGTPFNSPANCKYNFNTRDGILEVIYEDDNYKATHWTYPHRFYDRAIINEFFVTRKQQTGIIELDLKQMAGDVPGVDVTLVEGYETINQIEFKKYTGKTRSLENDRYDTKDREFYVLNEIPANEVKLTLTAEQAEFEIMYVTAADFKLDVVKKEIQDVMANKANIRQRHIDEWAKIWDKMNIIAEGNSELNEGIHTSLFSLISSLPALDTNQVRNPFYGLSPGGLGRGFIEHADFQGHSFWDTEMWMQPPILLLDPRWSAELINYRYNVKTPAYDIASESGYKGLQFPWESAYTGGEVTPDCCPEVVDYEHHITADIAWTVRQHLYATHDFDWFKKQGCHLAVETAKFWESRSIYNAADDHYEILYIMGPDEDHHNVNNSVFTNVVAGLNLHFGEFASCVCRSVLQLEDYEITTKWSSRANKLKLLVDPINNYNPQYDGYEKEVKIKQADVVLLGYPLMYSLNVDVQRNNLHIYERVTREDGPAMTWAMHLIGHLDIKNTTTAAGLIDRSYKPYLRKPFNVWTEVIEPYRGCDNFITGAGGFLQAIINGYGGVRLHNDTLIIRNSLLPPSTTKLLFKGITYLGSRFSIEVSSVDTKITLVSLNTEIPLKITINGVEQAATLNTIYNVASTDVFVAEAATYAFASCSLPLNLIKNVEMTSGTSHNLNSMLMIVVLVCVINFLR